jgi:RNA polymerase sigma-B factor
LLKQIGEELDCVAWETQTSERPVMAVTDTSTSVPTGRRPAGATETTEDRALRAERTTELLDRLNTAREQGDSVEHDRLVEELVLINLGIAHAIATRYRGRGLNGEDLEQVARLGLVKAAHGFDTTRQNDFLAYAVPTIRGEVRKHFRDQGWMVRPPRRIQELQSRIAAAGAELTQTLGRSPRPSEVAEHLGEELEDVQDALAADGCFSPSSLDRPAREDGGTATVGDLLPDDDHDQEAAEARVALAPVVRRLSERDRRILHLRFFSGWTQEEIARDIGVTQMHVSRLLARILADLREQLT